LENWKKSWRFSKCFSMRRTSFSIKNLQNADLKQALMLLGAASENGK
jgi:hypothetical protein